MTTRLRFLTWVYVVPLRDPFVLAKQAGSLAVLSNDRFVLGTGVGWLREEFETVGKDFHTRGRRMDEMLAVCRDFLADGYAEHHGEFFDFPRSAMFPAPDRPVPIWIGGHSLHAARRAAGFDGYIPMRVLDPKRPLDDATRREFGEIDAIREKEGLSGPFQRLVGATITNPDDVRRLEDQGITGVLVTPWTLSDYTTPLAEKLALAEQFADNVIARV